MKSRPAPHPASPEHFSVVRVTDPGPALITELEIHGRAALGESALDHWLIPVIARYGLLYLAASEAETLGAAELIRSVEDGEIYLEGLYIFPECQGRGHGTALLAGVIDACAAAGYRRLLATVDPANAAGRRLYEKAGFSQIEYLPDCYGAGRHRLLLAADLSQIGTAGGSGG